MLEYFACNMGIRDKSIADLINEPQFHIENVIF